MASAYSQDLRDRVIDAVARGEMSRRAAAVRFGVSESSAIKWVQRFERSGSRAASKMGGYLRPRLEPHREFLDALRRRNPTSPCRRFATGCYRSVGSEPTRR
jgi:transposase